MPLAWSATGVTTQTLSEIRTELQDAFLDPVSGVSPDLDVSDDSVFGRLIGVVAEREYSLQQQILSVWNELGVYATGVGLTRVALLTGTVRAGETHSTVTLDLTLDAGKTVSAGAVVSDSSGQALFETLADAVNGGGSPAVVSVAAQAQDPGPVVAAPGSLTVRVSAPEGLTGWTAVTNPAAAILGTNTETDPELRLRRAQELNQAGSSNLTAIVTDVLAVDGILSARGWENTTASTDGDGLPPHSYEIAVYGTYADDDVAQAIWDAGPAGIASVHGTAGGTSESGTATDSQGGTHTIVFTGADETTVYSSVNVEVDAESFPGDGTTQIADAVTAAIQAQGAIGAEIVRTKLYTAVYSVAGVLDVPLLALGLAPSPVTEVNLTIGARAFPLVGGVAVGVV